MSKRTNKGPSLLQKRAGELTLPEFIVVMIEWSLLYMISGISLGFPFGFLFFILRIVAIINLIRTGIGFLTGHSRNRAQTRYPNVTRHSAEEEDLPPTPVVQSRPKAAKRVTVPYEYTYRINRLQDLAAVMEKRRRDISAYLEEYFSGSKISVARYESVFNASVEALRSNASKAEKAVKMFGDGTPDAERLQILDNYVTDSEDIAGRMERIINELIKADQKADLDQNDQLDPQLDELAETTRYYTSGMGRK